MSDKGALALMKAVRKATIKPPVCKLVCIVMATYADPDGGNIYPSLKTVAAQCGIEERSVRRHVRSLEAMGILTLTELTRGGRGHKNEGNVYRMNQDALMLLENPDTRVRGYALDARISENPDTGVTQNPDTRVRKPGHQSPPTCHDLPNQPANKKTPWRTRSDAIARYLETRAWPRNAGPPPTYDELQAFEGGQQ